VEQEEDVPEAATQASQDINDPEQEPAEMTALKLELSTLSTSYTSLHSTLSLLQSQLVDLKRVNNELQEENESYNILLREKTLNGQFDILKMGAASASGESSTEDEAEDQDRDAESFVSRATGRSSKLDRVDELAEEHDVELDPGFNHPSADETEPREREEDEEISKARNPRSRHSRKRSSVSAPHGESLANLPITGPGLDLAAELGRAENKDIFEGQPLEGDHSVVNAKKKGKKSEQSNRKASGTLEPALETSTSMPNDLDALKNEVKSLKDANKALSLYASKIIDRIISQEGFEHVLAVDYDKSPTTPHTASAPSFAKSPPAPVTAPLPPPPAPKRTRPQSAIFALGSSSSSVVPTSPVVSQHERLTTFDSIPVATNTSTSPSPPPASPSPPVAASSTKASRRSMSFDWKSFGMFSGEKRPDPSANLRPLTLKAGAPPIITGARKLDTQEDEEDRKERERLNATMKLMGIETPPPTDSMGSPLPPMLKSYSTPVHSSTAVEPPPVSASISTPTTATAPSRFSMSFFRRTSSMTSSNNNSETSSLQSARSSPHPPASIFNTSNLTQEALEHAEALNTLAALDAHEKQLSVQIAKGGTGGFTEITRRSGDSRRSRKSGGSGSTVWSAGMSKGDVDEED